MKSKRLWLWITYYGVMIIANVVAAIVWKDYLNITFFSLFPPIWIIGLYYLAFVYPDRHRRPGKRFNAFSSIVYAISLPIPSVFILFFSNYAKLLIGAIVFIGNFISEIYCAIIAKKEDTKSTPPQTRTKKE